MKVLVDADACPVVNTVIQLCKIYHIECILLCDTAHIINRDDATTIVIDKGTDGVDFALVNKTSPGDIVITQDYGLASMCMAKKARIMHQDGWEYTPDNISGLMEQRHFAQKMRAAGVRTKGPRKRAAEQNMSFRTALEQLLQQMVQG